ncbi:MAG TPA: YncE family protein [Puia sp.]|nr:YncE family protein [Puia sp.]
MKIYSLKILLTGFLFLSLASKAQKTALYSFDKSISVPGDGGYDYLFIDDVNKHLFVSHGSSVNVIDLKTEKPIGSIDDMKGVHGIAIDHEVNRGFITDGGDKSVVVFDLKTFKKIKVIPVTPDDADGIMFDPFSKRVFAFCGDGNAASVIDVNELKEIGTIALGGGPEFAVPDGKGLIYNNLEDKNSLNVIDAVKMKVVRNYPLAPCGGPTGLAYDAKHQLVFKGCRKNKGMSVVDVKTGKVVSTLPIGAGVDAVVYDPVTNLIFCSNGDSTTTIIKQKSANDYAVVQTLYTKVRAKTMALDKDTHKIYLSVAAFQPGTRKIIPGSFEVLVYKMN